MVMLKYSFPLSSNMLVVLRDYEECENSFSICFAIKPFERVSVISVTHFSISEDTNSDGHCDGVVLSSRFMENKQ